MPVTTITLAVPEDHAQTVTTTVQATKYDLLMGSADVSVDGEERATIVVGRRAADGTLISRQRMDNLAMSPTVLAAFKAFVDAAFAELQAEGALPAGDIT